MTKHSEDRLPVDLVRPIGLLLLIATLSSVFIIANEIIMILFLGILFGVFLTKLASWISTYSPVGYRGTLAVVVSALLIAIVLAHAFFFVQINSQIDEASDRIDDGMSELGTLISEYPTLRTTIAGTPFLSDALDIKQRRQGSNRSNNTDDQAENKNEEGTSDQNSSDQSGLQLESIPEPVKQVASTVGQIFKTTFGLIVNSLLIFFVGLFLSISPTTYRDGLVSLVPVPKRERYREVFDRTGDTLWRWLIGRFGSMLATGSGAFLLLLVLGVPMAATLGILTALLTFIPNIGAAVALFLAVMFALPQGTGTVGFVVGGYMGLQLFESYVVTPLIQQKAVSLPPALLISFQAIMGVLFGFIGAAVASPLLAAGKTMVEMLYIDDYLESPSTDHES
ncbi:AI-2E family transporter [Rubripirellula amarantea]|nr:AI-2E family transporter [Rubripirellula amarantea]